jgi:hypothetical protein
VARAGQRAGLLKFGRVIRYRLADVEAWELSGLVWPRNVN